MPSGTWTNLNGGNWGLNTNWSGNQIANGAGDTATFSLNIAAIRTITVNIPVTIGTLTVQDTGSTFFWWVFSRASTNQLTLDNLASKPVISSTNEGALFNVADVLAGTNGFRKTGGSFVYFGASQPISGTVDIEQGYLQLGLYNTAGSPAVLPNITAFSFTNVGNDTVFYYRGLSAFTETRPITASSTHPTFSSIVNNMNNTLTFASTSNIASFTGNIVCDVNNDFAFAENVYGTSFPAAANALSFNNYSTTSVARTQRMVVAHTAPASLAGTVRLFDASAVSGSVSEWRDNGTGSTTLTNVQKTGSVSSAHTIRFGGTNALVTIGGNILQTAGTLSLDKTSSGRLVIAGTNALSGSITIGTGVVEVQNVAGLGAATASGVTTSGTGQIELTAGGTYNKSSTNFTIHATNPIVSVGNNVLQTLGITLSGTPNFNVTSGNKLTLAPQGAGVISGSFGLTKSGDGELELTAKANTFNGTVTVSAGTLTIGSVANSGSPGAWGQGSSAVEVTGTLRYNGSGGSTTRSVRMNGTGTPTIDASGTGALFLNSVTQDTNAKTMVLRGTNTNANTISSNIADNSGAVSLSKLDGGRWVLAGGTLSYTGTTTVSDGTLRIETANSNTTSGAVTIGASGTVELITDTLASSGATAGEVLGTGNVTVNGGTIKTRGGTTQKGQVRYGGNLTFGSGSTLYIGAAA